MTDTPKAPAVLTAIHAISAALAKVGIGKDSFNKEQRFAFRGIDAVMNALAPLLVEHRLVIVPQFFDRVLHEKTTKAGGLMFNVTVRGEFHFVSVDDGTEIVAKTVGEGQDTADKATNKAMAVAYKYAVFQTFCIPLEASDDPDAGSPEGAVRDRATGLDDLTEEFELRTVEVPNLKELADVFAKAQTDVKAAAVAREVPKSVLVDALGKLTKSKDGAKARIEKAARAPKGKPADNEGGPRGDEPTGTHEAGNQ
jgi:hypothetical protein